MPQKFRKIVLKSSKHHLLEDQKNEDDEEAIPHSIDIDGQTIDLKPIQEKKARSGSDLSKAMDLMKTHSDYEVVIQLVEAMSYSKIDITENQWARCIRKLGLAGRPGLAKSIAWYSNDCRNSFPLTFRTCRELFRSNLPRHFMPGNSYLHMVYERLENLRTLVQKKWSLKNDHGIIGVELFITANIKKTFGEADKGHNAKKYTEKFMQALRRHQEASKLDFDHSEPSYYKLTHRQGTYKWYDAKITSLRGYGEKNNSPKKVDESIKLAREAISDYDPLLAGLRIAKDLLTNPQNADETEAAKEMLSTLNLDQKITELEEHITRWRSVQLPDSTLGLEVYRLAAEKLRAIYFLGEDGISGEEKNARRYDFIADREPIPGSWYASTLETSHRSRGAPSTASS